MSLPNPSQDAVPFTPLTAEFYDDTIENIEALAAGTGLDDGAVESIKLAEAFLRGRYQANATNTAPLGLTLQHGWGFVNATAAASISDSVTFPVAFATLRTVLATLIGVKAGSDPTGVTALASAERTILTAHTLATTGFSVIMRNNNDSNFAAGTRYVYSWVALGEV